MRSWAAVAACLIAGCGPSICDRRLAIADDCGAPLTDTELAACQTSLDSCSRDERKDLDALLDCLEREGYADCDAGAGDFPGLSVAQIEALLACEAAAAKLSDSCLAATGRVPLTTFTP